MGFNSELNSSPATREPRFWVGEAPPPSGGGPLMVGRSAPMRHLIEQVEAVAESDAPVLIGGESGTGKELLARAIHHRSRRAAGPLVALNCAAFPDSLVDAELFGHEKGAFTGAVQRRDGRFKAAHGGTLFLDEVGELSAPTQAKLLRVLQEGTFEPLGTCRTVKVDVRILSATHRNLQEMVIDGRFRADLYYRLKVVTVEIPPLRDRCEDLPALVDVFLDELRESNGPGSRVPHISSRAWEALVAYPFPGNVRELRHALEHATVMSRGGEIDLDVLPPEIVAAHRENRGARPAAATAPLHQAIHEFERHYLVEALRECAGCRTTTAQMLGISRKNLWEKIRGYEITPDELRASTPKAARIGRGTARTSTRRLPSVVVDDARHHP